MTEVNQRMSQMKSVFSRIDSYRDEIIDLQRELTARVALGPQMEVRENTKKLRL